MSLTFFNNKQGGSLDNLVKKFSDESTIEAGLENVRVFNRDTSFYPGYAKNFVSKSVMNNAEGDPRVGYIRQVSYISHCTVYWQLLVEFARCVLTYPFLLTTSTHIRRARWLLPRNLCWKVKWAWSARKHKRKLSSASRRLKA
jgi:hypothetical protein